MTLQRTQVVLDEETQRRARKRAAELGVSFAEYIRRLVASDLREPAPRKDPSLVFNLGTSSDADIAQRKDAMVGEAIAAAYRRDAKMP